MQALEVLRYHMDLYLTSALCFGYTTTKPSVKRTMGNIHLKYFSNGRRFLLFGLHLLRILLSRLLIIRFPHPPFRSRILNRPLQIMDLIPLNQQTHPRSPQPSLNQIRNCERAGVRRAEIYTHGFKLLLHLLKYLSAAGVFFGEDSGRECDMRCYERESDISFRSRDVEGAQKTGCTYLVYQPCKQLLL
jgi:hypothetical protein